MALRVRLHHDAFDPLAALAAWQRHLELELELDPSSPPEPSRQRAAAEAHFIGRVRGINAAGEPLDALELEHYPGMTEAQIEHLAAAVSARHGLIHALVEHRVGRALPGEALVLVAVGADRRGPAQRGCQELLEALKHEAPFWKREWIGSSGRWIEGNTPL
ncbi:molybdenum cofactor biosynthesis protein MoaE [Synechococcus sp. CS-602]|uniref:molybdopterin synthase catalytic subunit n=1 Tax=Synechococcaceae TaxID=1890426 RepID=UPI0008FF4954|nr:MULTISPECIES: molybdenum cofactor biosynthesis protein MoaE [Synechococcaceae]MCT4363769.1 molybdenum cofactor biosynthesis protein MoaE [Candidatus Regnicoccus frigidus MAG-AL1]APD47965.1 molybdenum cofactor biosynthesis protein MoaE [Synechococcus sp. SynAce01]MCT0201050.1 molybdenum cofactor biosynthesis protein MoaE [Synechococcus sp. CS-603]MCT0204513.1 molybdenum cofactor biosynthesis protein MoaE [Synechococcus sp. CS-602]MCT0245416.1 molybdenum cofactor biosynthesis protein MoaE [Sy